MTPRYFLISFFFATVKLSIVKIMGIALSTYKFQVLCETDEPYLTYHSLVLYEMVKSR